MLSMALAKGVKSMAEYSQLDSELAVARSLGQRSSGREHLHQLLMQGDAMAAIENALWKAIEKLVQAGAATGEELQDKFLSQGVGLLTYANLNAFFGG